MSTHDVLRSPAGVALLVDLAAEHGMPATESLRGTSLTRAALEDLDIKYPVEYVTLLAAANAKLALECGYTAARSGGSLFNIDVWLAKAIDEEQPW